MSLLKAIYPVSNGVGFIGLLISGLVMLRKRKVKQKLNNLPQTPI